MQEGYIAIVDIDSMAALLEGLERAGLIPMSPAGTIVLLNPDGDEILVGLAEYREAFSRAPSNSPSVGVLWSDWDSITWQSRATPSGQRILTLFGGNSLYSISRNVLAHTIGGASVTVRLLIVDPHGFSDEAAWINWSCGGVLPDVAPDLVAVNASSLPPLQVQLSEYESTSYNGYVVFWNPVFVEGVPWLPIK
jgi:hypothetical protein